jgi:thiol:disulfide interchange protein DsbD
MKRFFVMALLLLAGFRVMAGPAGDKVKWNFSASKINDSTFNLNITANIAKGWHIFSFTPGGDGSLLPPEFTFTPNKNVQLLGKMQESGKVLHEDTKDVMGVINYYKGKVTYTQQAKVTANTTLKGNVYFMVCDSTTCLPPEQLNFQIKMDGKGSVIPATDGAQTGDKGAVIPGQTGGLSDSGNNIGATSATALADSPKVAAASGTTLSNDKSTSSGTQSLWAIFLTGLVAGLVAFITPCIYAMLPITVSFFTKRSKNRATGIKNAVIYSISIIGIFALIGVLISLSFSETTMYTISTSLVFNLFVFIIFIIFGISLLGAFEITLPASWSTKLDTKANSTSFWGIFFMALVLVIVSFSCTSAFISWLIVQIVQAHNRLGGLVGFLGFGVAIAFPFALFAFFPGLLNNVAKSGGWLNSVKVTMGFVEIAMSMKFLSNVDLQYHWHLLNYDVYLSIWIVLFGLLGLYLLGKIKFSHDDELPKNIFGQPYLSVTRLTFAIASLAFTMYMIPGLFGAPLTGISGWLPEKKTSEFKLYENILAIRNGQLSITSSGNIHKDANEIRPQKYTDFLESELPGVTVFFDYQEALAASKASHKPILLDFTGHSCVNCRKMERSVLSKPQVIKDLNEHFIMASLYCDDRTPLAKDEIFTNKDGDKISTLGAKNLDLEVSRYGSAALPMYVFVDSEGNVIKNAGGYVDDVDRFVRIMQEVKEAYKKQHP